MGGVYFFLIWGGVDDSGILFVFGLDDCSERLYLVFGGSYDIR